jgi:hypothetical protein
MSDLAGQQMSYDFHLLRRAAGEDPLGHAQREHEDFGPPEPTAERIKQCVARALVAQNPHLEAFKFDYEKIARGKIVRIRTHTLLLARDGQRQTPLPQRSLAVQNSP